MSVADRGPGGASWVGRAHEAQGGPQAHHRPRELRRGHHDRRARCGRRSSARPRRTLASSPSTRRPPRRATTSCSSPPVRTSTASPGRCRWPGCRPASTSTRPSTGRWPRAPSSTSATRSPSSSAPTATRVVDAADEVAVEYDPLPVVVDPRGGPQGRDDHPRGARHEHLAPLVARRRRPRGRLRRGRPHHRASRRQPPHGRRRDRAPRRARRLPRRRADDLDQHAGPALRAPVPRHPARHQPGPRPRGRAGRRRRVRLQAADVRRGGPALLGRPQARAAGQVDRDPLGEHAGLPPRARPDRQGAHGRQERRLDHRVPRRHPGRLRRVPPAAHADDPVARGLRDAGAATGCRPSRRTSPASSRTSSRRTRSAARAAPRRPT